MSASERPRVVLTTEGLHTRYVYLPQLTGRLDGCRAAAPGQHASLEVAP
jgi:hypothetical protein